MSRANNPFKFTCQKANKLTENRPKHRVEKCIIATFQQNTVLRKNHYFAAKDDFSQSLN